VRNAPSIASRLTTELHNRGILLTLAFFEKGERSRNIEEEAFPSGIDEIERLVRSLGDDYLGALLYCGWGVPESAAAVIRMLLGFKKPVADFDPTEKHHALAREVAAWEKPVFYHARFVIPKKART
jgi:hypothetical protein